MHAKFILVEGPQEPYSTFGSMNLNPRSRLLNHELLLLSREVKLFERLDARWEQITAECGELRAAAESGGAKEPG